jgi:2-keto-4-pentenoate hydratase/2-oxohepta-3-ene-1,7-dioic acid hydratase in catechol pathway
MRLASAAGRLVLDVAGTAVDVERASDGRFSADPQAVYERWDEFREWAATVDARGTDPFGSGPRDAPVPRPRQVFGVAVNYAAHAVESKMDLPPVPLTFTKFPSCIIGPDDDVELPNDTIDWEVELVVVIGRRAERVSEEDGWDHVAGLTIGQDLSDRTLQFLGDKPQFSLGKSFPGAGPTGPEVVTPDEFADRDDIALQTVVNGELMQDGRTSKLVFGVPALVARLSALVTLLPGDLIFTGTPSGVGFARTPPVFLKPGDELVSRIEGIGELRTTMAKG